MDSDIAQIAKNIYPENWIKHRLSKYIYILKDKNYLTRLKKKKKYWFLYLLL